MKDDIIKWIELEYNRIRVEKSNIKDIPELLDRFAKTCELTGEANILNKLKEYIQ